MADEFASTIGKVAAGAAGASLGLVGGVCASIVSLPVAPYFLAMAIMKKLDHLNAKGPFIYYVCKILRFLDPLPPYISMVLVLQISKNCHFLTPPPLATVLPNGVKVVV